MSVELALLNAVIAKRDLSTIVRQGLADESSWLEQRDAYTFIRRHVEEFGELPDVASVVAKCPAFETWTSDESMETLCAKLHDRNEKVAIRGVLEKAAKMYAEVDGFELGRYLHDNLEKIRDKANARHGGAANLTRNTDERLTEYDKRAAGEYGTAIPLFWDEIDGEVGGFHRGDYVNLSAWTKRGKSWLSLLAGITANRAGYKVLAELAESTKDETGFRFDTVEFGVSNRGLWAGSLDSIEYQTYVRKLDELRTSNRPDFVIKTPEDWRKGLTVDQIEADIDQYGPDVVIVDQFNLMNHGGKTWQDKADTSRRLKLLFARKGVVGIVVTQADGDYGKRTREDEDDVRELRPPSESDYSETIAVIQDATHVLAFDSIQWPDATTGKARGKAQMIVRVSRTGGAGAEVDLEWQPNDGCIRPRQPSDLF